MVKSHIKAILKGMQRNVEACHIDDDGFVTLNDCYQYRDCIRKRVGTNLIRGDPLNSRLRVKLGNGDESGNYSFTVPGKIFTIGQVFSIEKDTFIVVEEGENKNLKTSYPVTSATFSTTDGKVNIQGSYPGSAIYFYPNQPVMGIIRRELTEINFEDTIVFDTQFSYQMGEFGWERLGSGADSTWTGDDTNFFWGVNFRAENVYQKAVFVTNNNSADNIRFLRENDSEWVRLRPKLNKNGTTRYLDTCKFLFVFENYLCAANTRESTEGGSAIHYYNRIRRAQRGLPTDVDNSWVDDVTGQGGFITADLQQQITSTNTSYSIRIITLERAARMLVYTGYPDDPMRLERISDTLGVESTFSLVSNDETTSCVGVGNIGIIEITPRFNGAQRIDKLIPDEVYKIRNCCQNVDRVHGIQHQVAGLIYWTLPHDYLNSRYPQRLLVMNYINGNFAYFYDSITCFGYYQERQEMTWETVENYFPTWDAWNEPWDAGKKQTAFPDVIAGNQQGFVFVMNQNNSTNAISLMVTSVEGNVFNCIRHNLILGVYIRIELDENSVIVQVIEIIDENHFRVDYLTCSPQFDKAIYIRRVSNPEILSKEYTPGASDELSTKISALNLLLKTTDFGQHTIDYYRDASQEVSIYDSQNKINKFYGDRTIRTYPEMNKEWMDKCKYIWHKFTRQCNGAFVQWRLYMRDEQIRDWDIASQDFALYEILYEFEQAGKLI